MAADESTISWGPSPTFGELVSWSLPRGAEPRLGSLIHLLKMRRKNELCILVSLLHAGLQCRFSFQRCSFAHQMIF